MYVYVLYSEKDGKRYTGFAEDLKERIKAHHSGLVPSTKWRRPLRLVYYEWCVDRADARHRECYLKTYYGKRYLKNRMKYYFANEQ